MPTKSIFLFFLLAIGMLACEDVAISEERLLEQRKLQLTNTLQAGILPAHQSFLSAAESLHQLSQTFRTTPTEDHLIAFRKQWKEAASSWKRCEFYDLGEISDSFIHFRIYRRPTNIEQLEETISNGELIDLDYVESQGSAVIGLAAIEYLLFEAVTDTSLQSFQADTKRADYLLALTAYLLDQAQALQESWGDYGPTFTNSLQSSIDGGQNLLVNAIVSALEETNKDAIGKPLGEASGGIAKLELLEAHRSSSSMSLIKATFREVKASFRGDYPNSESNYGFDDYLVALKNKELLDKIDTAIDKCEATLAELGGPDLKSTLATKPEAVAQLQLDFTALLLLVKIDMASFIGAIIVPNESDGD
ncbi:MAG: imelysin family protein [Bacteroidota bacterium]